MSQPTIKVTAYSGIYVFEYNIRGINVMRRLHDDYLNATQILRAAGLAKPQRTKVLEKDVSRGIHEKVQGGYAGFQGTWIPKDSALQLAQEYGLEEEITTLIEREISPELQEEMKNAPPPKRPTPRTPNQPSQKWSVSSLSGSDDEHRAVKSRSRQRTSRFSPLNDSPGRAKKPRYDSGSNSRKQSRQRTNPSPSSSSLFTAPGPQPNHAFMNDLVAEEDKVCEMCGTQMTPQWRRGPSGKSLCNACGVKYKIKRYIGERRNAFIKPQDKDFSSSSNSESIEDAAHLTELKDHVKHLKKKLKFAEKDHDRMSDLYKESLIEDRDIDQEYRQLLLHSTAKQNEFSVGKDGELAIKRFIRAVKKYRETIDSLEEKIRLE